MASVFRRYSGSCFGVSRIGDGTVIPAGGIDGYLQNDFGRFGAFFHQVGQIHGRIDPARLAAWLERKACRTDPVLFAAAWAVQKTIHRFWPQISGYNDMRPDFYTMGTPALLSAIIASGAAESCETAALAHGALNRLGLRNLYVRGGFLPDPSFDKPEGHSFLVLRQGDHACVFDPANPVYTAEGIFPSLYRLDRAQLSLWSGGPGDAAILTMLENDLSGAVKAYGLSGRAACVRDSDPP